MKTAPIFYTDNDETVLAFQKPDLEASRDIFEKAKWIWWSEWKLGGATDKGSCCGGKGIQTWYVGPRKRTAHRRTVVSCSWIQGNLSASGTVDGALGYLRAEFPELEFRYNDGWMD